MYTAPSLAEYAPPASFTDPGLAWLAAASNAEACDDLATLVIPKTYIPEARVDEPSVEAPTPREEAEQLVTSLFEPERVGRLGHALLDGAGVIPIDSLPGKEQARARNLDCLAAAAMHGTVTTPGEVTPPKARADTLKLHNRAREGDEQARRDLLTNIETTVSEQLATAGAIMVVNARINEDGEIVQGQWGTTEERQFNTYRVLPSVSTGSGDVASHAIGEGQNVFHIEALHKLGLLQGKRVLEFSFAPDRASQKELSKLGYKLDQVLAFLRVTTISPDGDVEIVTLPVGGVDEDTLPAYHPGESEEETDARQSAALQNRIDTEVGKEMHARLGRANTKDMTSDEQLTSMYAMPENCDVIDVAMLYDQIATKLVGKPTFFGLVSLHRQFNIDRPLTRADYEAYIQKSLDARGNVPEIAESSLDEVLRTHLQPQTAKEAADLHRLTAKDKAVFALFESKEPDVDLSVYGSETHALLQQARELAAIQAQGGDVDVPTIANLVREAQEKAKPTGCPSGSIDDVISKVADLFKKKSPPDDEVKKATTKDKKKDKDNKSGSEKDEKKKDKERKKAKDKKEKHPVLRNVDCPSCCTTNAEVHVKKDGYYHCKACPFKVAAA